MSRPRLIALLLALAALAVYLPATRHGFCMYDDGDYVTDNEMVQRGWTLAGVKWAFTTFHSANWHPLTWLSHMTDCQLFGLNASGHHFVNALLHAANTVLLFALWLRVTSRDADSKTSASTKESDALWPAAFIAALFALHPLHVESVAWVAERKDVLSTFFGLLALLCYSEYTARDRNLAAQPKESLSHATRHSSLSYWLSFFFFACGLMSKPMLVTLPFVMLLLDYWPLQRFNASTFQRLLFEKIPFFLLTVVSSFITYLAQSTGAVASLTAVPLVYRFENAPVALASYLLKMVWPIRLAIIYPMPDPIPPAAIIASLAALIFITIVAWRTRKQSPFLLVGWLWFLGTLVPVLGLVKVGDAALADRYTYIPSIGIFIAVAFGAQKTSLRFSLPKYLFPVAGAFILGALTVITEKQLQYWSDNTTLFSHAIQVTKNNVDAMVNYGAALELEGKPVEAMVQYRRAEQLAPSSYIIHFDIANQLNYMGKPADALAEYRQAVQLKPNLLTLHDGMGGVLFTLGRFTEATNEYHIAMRLDPNSPSPHFYLGIALAAHNDFAAATNEFSEALRLAPDNPATFVEWGRALLQQGRDAEAVEKFNEALQVDQENYQTLAYIAHVLAADEHAEIRNGAAALALAQKASTLTDGRQPIVEDVLGMAYAENGKFDEAQNAASHAISLATAAGIKPDTIAAMQKRLELYQKHEPWRESFSNGRQ